MRTTIKRHLKSAILSLSLAIYCCVATSFKVNSEKFDIAGTWVLNLAKSDFGDSPLYVVPKKATITNDKDIINMTIYGITSSGMDTSATIHLSMSGKPVDIITADQRTRHYNTTWTDVEGTLKVEYSSSYSSKPDTEQYHTIDIWKLSTGGKELILNKQVKVDNSYGFTVKAVYDKQ
ncbi:MAG: hypothetical protein JWR50_2135 [Mucilaginibacter sp.]|nr:hypothetical protein [Mucilaginibacter sp.]